MKQVTVTITYVISDSKLVPTNDPNSIGIRYLENHGTAIGKDVQIQQLYNVQVPTTQMYFEDFVKKGERTEDGFLAFNGEKFDYTRGVAIKKARTFMGKVVPNEE